MSELQKRILTAIAGIGVFAFCIFYNSYTYFGLFLVLSSFCLWEFYCTLKRSNKEGLNVSLFPSFILHIIYYASFFFLYCDCILSGQFFIPANSAILIFVLGVFILVIIELFKKSENPFLNIGMSVLGFVYITFPFAIMHFIAIKDTYEPWKIMSIFIIIWSNDTFAYFSGRLMGKHKLFERLSPKKTWEGFIGGMLFSLVAAYILYQFLGIYSLTIWLLLSLIISVFGTLGDLVESMLKRSLQIKDSGGSLPGHGGFLDRFDSFIFALPFVYALLYLVDIL